MVPFKAPEVLRAGVSGAPTTDWALYDKRYIERCLDSPQDNAAGYKACSVLPCEQDLCSKLPIMHGMVDDNVPFLSSTNLFCRLQAIAKPFEIMLYPGEGPGLIRQHNGRRACATILNLFNQTYGL